MHSANKYANLQRSSSVLHGSTIKHSRFPAPEMKKEMCITFALQLSNQLQHNFQLHENI